MELKVEKNVLCLIVVGLLDLRVRGQSDDIGAERRGVFGDLRISRLLQSGEEESQCGWCVFRVSPLSLCDCLSVCLSLSWSSGPRTVVYLLLIYPAVEKFIFYIVFLFWSDQIGFSLFFYCKGLGLTEKILLIIFIFWQISSTFRYAPIRCAETPFLHFEESLTTDNIRWAQVAIIILCVR